MGHTFYNLIGQLPSLDFTYVRALCLSKHSSLSIPEVITVQPMQETFLWCSYATL